MNYIKHLIECQCTLKIYEKKSKPVFHKFQVFSTFNENVINEKYVTCNNCDIVHKVTEVCKSKIQWGKENLRDLINTKEDIKFNLIAKGKQNITDLLEENMLDISGWEMIEHLIENNIEGQIVLSKKEIEENIVYKVLYISKNGYKIKTEIAQRYL
jgi:hypothetical protein